MNNQGLNSKVQWQAGTRRRVLSVLSFAALAVWTAGCGQSNVASTGGGGGGGGSTGAGQGVVSTGPQLGYSWIATDQSLRPILGVPGATHFGDSVVSSGLYVAGAASSATATALFEDAKGNLLKLQLPGSNPQSFGTGLSGAAKIIFAPAGVYAVAFVSGSKSLQLISALPQGQITTIALSGPVAGVTVNDSGSLLAAVQSSASSVSIFAGASGNLANIAKVGGFGGFAFVPGTQDAVLADGSSNAFTYIQNVTAGPTFKSVALANGILNQPVALGVTADGRWAVVANHGDNSVARIDLSGATPAVDATCHCIANQVTGLNNGNVFQLSDAGTGPAWMVDASATSPRVLFIPAASSKVTGAGQ